MRHDLTLMQVRAVLDMLGDELADDETLKLDTLEGETDLFELCRRLLNRIEDAEGDKAVLIAQIQDRNERKARCETRIESYRSALRALLEAAQVDKLPLPEATVTLRKLPPKAIVTDETALPDEFVKVVRKPDLAAIKAAETLPAGCSLDNGGVSLTIRRR